MSLTLAQSYTACQTIARRAASSFYPTFRLLPAPQRKAMCAVYAFLRIADDISDQEGEGEGEVTEKRKQLTLWREGLERALRGDYTHPIHGGLHDAVTRFGIPPAYFSAALDGVQMDLAPVAYATFADLEKYCYHVASVVGLACIHIWGFKDKAALAYAAKAGIAFQLTNIIRDLGKDAGMGRVYLPAEDLERFGYGHEQLRLGLCNAPFRDLMRFQIARARDFYDAAWPLVPLLRPPGRMVFLVMARTYRALLDSIEQNDYDVFSNRIRVRAWQKFKVLLGALPARWGWAPMSS